MPSKTRAAATSRKGTEGIKEIRLSLSSSTNFDAIGKTLREVLTLPEIGSFRGCRPCLSGLDRIIIEDPEFQQQFR
jgi:hypothetical protein